MTSKKLNIGFVLDDTLDTTDGVQQYVLRMGKWLTRQGHDVHYLVGHTSRKDIENVHSLARNVRVKFNKNRLTIPLPSNKKQIKKKLKELNLDILHVQMPYSPFFAGSVINNSQPRTKIIGTFHIVPAGKMQYYGAKGLKYLNTRTSKKFNKIICVSKAAADFAKAAFNYDSVILPNVVDVEKFKHKAVRHKKPTIVFLGRLVERKGCKQLLDALLVLQNRYQKPYQVIIAGVGPLKTELQLYAVKNDIKNIEFIGFVTEATKPELLAGADIAVFPSIGGESFGIVLIEAMAAGSRVVLGGDNEGYRTVLENYPDLLIDPNSPASFADRLEYYLDHEQAREKAYTWAQEHVKNYDINHVGKQLLDVYSK